MNIAFFETQNWEKEMLKKHFVKHQLSFSTTPLSEEHIPALQETEVISVFIYSQLTASVLARLPKLRLIATRSTGYDHIDLAACKKRCSVSYRPR